MRVKLGNIAKIYTGTGFPLQYQGNTSGKYPFYKVGDISRNAQNGNIYLEDCNNYVDDDTVMAICGTIVPEHSIVFAKIGEAVKLNRRAITRCQCLVDNNAIAVCPDCNQVSLMYFFYYLCAVKMEKLAEATTVPSVKKAELSN
ncbi:MAG: restriction endonuclease subunit S [Oscillospiraceae bacterium]|nr:restriction endonuclease subunit S [Oscillospiraceae bacterium]